MVQLYHPWRSQNYELPYCHIDRKTTWELSKCITNLNMMVQGIMNKWGQYMYNSNSDNKKIRDVSRLKHSLALRIWKQNISRKFVKLLSHWYRDYSAIAVLKIQKFWHISVTDRYTNNHKICFNLVRIILIYDCHNIMVQLYLFLSIHWWS